MSSRVALKQAAAWYMLVLAAAVAGNFVATQLYDPAGEGTSAAAWRVLDPMMVAGTLLALVFAFARKRRQDGRARVVDREYLEANVSFYVSAALLLVLLWNWIGTEWVDPPNAIGLLWVMIDTALPLLLASTALRLLRSRDVGGVAGIDVRS